MTIDQQFIEYIVKSLVNNPDDVIVDRIVDEKGVLLSLTVNAEDLGRVIGKRGTTAQSLRTLLRALGTKNDARYNLKIVDVNQPEGGYAPSSAPARSDEPADDQTVASSDDESVDETDTTPVASEEKEDAYLAPVEESTPEEPEDDHNDVVSKTRAELEELDDLDI